MNRRQYFKSGGEERFRDKRRPLSQVAGEKPEVQVAALGECATVHRRCETGIVGGAGLGALPEFAARSAAPIGRIGVGISGCGGMGHVNLTDFQANPEVDLVAVCDVYEPRVRNFVEETKGNTKAYRDYRKLLEDGNVDAVVIVTAGLWHALPCVDVRGAGKDVYVEKPLPYCLREGRLMVEAARRSCRIVQVGLQQRCGAHFQRAVQIVQSGQLGKALSARCWNHVASAPECIGNPADSEPPDGLDWNFWLDWGCHLIDIVVWAMGAQGPVSATACGGKYYFTDNRDTPDTLEVLYEFPAFLLHYSAMYHNSFGHNGDRGAKPISSYGILLHGSSGTLFIDRAGYEVIPQTHGRRLNAAASSGDFEHLTGYNLYFETQLKPEMASTSAQHAPHVRNFLDCVKSRKQPIADIEAGHRATTVCHLGNIALRSGQKVLWDSGTARTTNIEEANRLEMRLYRAP